MPRKNKNRFLTLIFSQTCLMKYVKENELKKKEIKCRREEQDVEKKLKRNLNFPRGGESILNNWRIISSS